MSLLRLDHVSREIGTLVILDEVSGAVALGERIGLVGPNGAGKTTLLRIAAGIDEPDRGSVVRKRGLSLGLLAQESHFDAAFMAAPDLRMAVRTGAAHLDVMAAALAEMEHSHRVTEAAYADLQHRFEVHGGYTLDQRVEAALSGLGFARDEWSKPPTALSGGEQTRPRWRGWSSPTRTCCCSTSRPTTSTSTPSSGSRSTSAGGRARCSWRATTGPSSMPRSAGSGSCATGA